jgi:hypothetical protein
MTRPAIRSAVPLSVAALLLAAAAKPARAQDELDAINRAVKDYNEGKNKQAAIGFYRIEEAGTVEENRSKAEYYLAQALNNLGLGFSAFFYYGQIIKAGPSHPYYLKAVEGAVGVAESYNDEVLGPSVLNKAYNDQFERLPPEVLSKINYYIALLGYRAGRYSEAEQFLAGVPEASSVFAQAQYLAGLLAQRRDPERAVKIFRGILQLGSERRYRELPALKELTQLALGRTLYGLRRYPEASASYAALPRFSRHWDEALFEGAYADVQNDDPGSALGKLHSLHSPHLSDEFAPESENLAAIIYYQNCLYPQVRESAKRFEAEYVPVRDRVKALLDKDPPLDAFVTLVTGGAIAGAGLPTAVQHYLQKNERIGSMLGYIARLDAEAGRIQGDVELSKSALGVDLLDLIGKQRGLVVQVAGRFVKGRLVDLAHLIDVLEGEKEIIAFETAKGEKEFLEGNVDLRRLAQQKLHRPAMPGRGHEYWPFDGEYWPDEIGYYKYTLKNACSLNKKDE